MKTEKYIIAFDTICDGYQVETDENNIPSPELFETYEDCKKKT